MYVFSISIWSYKTPTNRTSTKHICWKGDGKRARGMLNRKLIIRLTTKTTTKRLFIIKHIMSPKVSKVFFVNLKVKHNCLRLTIQQLISLKKGGIVCYCYKTIYFSYKIFIFSFPHQQKKTPRDERKLVAVVLWNVITKYGSGNYRDDFLLFQLFSNDTTILYYFFE